MALSAVTNPAEMLCYFIALLCTLKSQWLEKVLTCFSLLNLFVLVFSDFLINCQNSCILDEKYIVLPISQYSSIQN